VDVDGGKRYELTIPIGFDRVMRAVIPASNWNSVPNRSRQRCIRFTLPLPA
jgi:hypothetical protein